jgi:hypothetical protein
MQVVVAVTTDESGNCCMLELKAATFPACSITMFFSSDDRTLDDCALDTWLCDFKWYNRKLKNHAKHQARKLANPTEIIQSPAKPKATRRLIFTKAAEKPDEKNTQAETVGTSVGVRQEEVRTTSPAQPAPEVCQFWE